jgi:hypothetical protein
VALVWSDETPSRLSAAFFSAALLHGAFAALVYSSSSEEGARPMEPVALSRPGEIDLDETPLDIASIAGVERQDESEARFSTTVENHFVHKRPTDAAQPDRTADGAATTPQDRLQGYSLDPARAHESAAEREPVNLGIEPGSWSLWVDAAAPVAVPLRKSAERLPGPASSTGGLVEALEARDRELGLGPAGRVLSAAHEAGHSDVAPAIGTAIFSITVLRSGGIQVELVGASSNVAAWRKVANDMALAIEKKPPRIDGARNGVRIALELVAEERWPNGAPARSEGPSIALSAGTLRTSEQAIEDLRKRNPAAAAASDGTSETPPLEVHSDLPGVWLKGRGKVCAYQLGISLLGPSLSGGCDPSNIGAPPSRVVSVKVTNQTML